jgi:ubiquitin-like modifier-activating enzyme ATG7
MNQFFLITFADLKKFHFYYWFSFPTASLVPLISFRSPPVTTFNNEVLILREIELYLKNNVDEAAFLVSKVTGNCFPFSSLKQKKSDFTKDFYLAFLDPSTEPLIPGWPLRNILAVLHRIFTLESLHVLCLRITPRATKITSLLLHLNVSSPTSHLKFSSGWEKRHDGKLGYKFVNMSNTLDPKKLSELAVDLNLRLMRWRQM